MEQIIWQNFNMLQILQPWETYTADVSIDVTKHHKPENFRDKFAYWTVQSLKYPTHLFFQVFI